MKLRTCTVCGAPFTPRNRRVYQCPAHEATGRESRSPSTRAQRDGTGDYERNRRIVLAPDPVTGLPPRCALRIHCNGAPATHADHIVPVASGGTNALENLTPACERCNLSKQARRPR